MRRICTQCPPAELATITFTRDSSDEPGRRGARALPAQAVAFPGARPRWGKRDSGRRLRRPPEPRPRRRRPVAGLDDELEQHVGGEVGDREPRPPAEGLEQARVEAGAGAQRQRLAGEEPAERPLAAAPLEPPVARVAGDAREAGVEGRPGRPLEHLREPAVEQDQPAREPGEGVRRVRGADDAVDVLLAQLRRGPADLNDPLQHDLPSARAVRAACLLSRGCRAIPRLIASAASSRPEPASRRAAAAANFPATLLQIDYASAAKWRNPRQNARV